MAVLRVAAAAFAAAVILSGCGDETSPGSGRSSEPTVTQTPGATPSFLPTQLDAIRDDIAKRTSELLAAGADVAFVKVDDAAKVVVVGLRGDIARGTAVLNARYPREALRIEAGEAGH